MPHFFDFVGGYSFLLEKLSVWLVYQLVPLKYLPLGIAIFSITIYSAVFSLVNLSTFRTWIPKDLHRFFVSILFCFAPGLGETIGNFANLPSILLLLMFFLSLYSSQNRLAWWHTGVAVLCVFSMGTFLIFSPLFVTFLVLKWQRGEKPYGEVAISVAMLVHAALIVSGQNNLSPSYPEILKNFFTVLIPFTIRGLFFQPWLGDTFTAWIADPSIKFWQFLLAIFFVVSASLPLRHAWNEKNTKILFWTFVCVCSWPLLSWASRPGTIARFLGVPMHFWKDRYAVPLGFFSPFLWLWWTEKSRVFPGIKTAFVSYLLFSMTVWNFYRFPIPRYTEKPIWEEALAQTEKLDSIPVAGIPSRELDWRLYLH